MASEPALGLGIYRAEQAAGTVTVYATGEAPAAGYTVWLEKTMIDVYPPEFILFWEPPEGMALDVMTPFSVHVSFPADEPVARVTVRDEDGVHQVPVKQAA